MAPSHPARATAACIALITMTGVSACVSVSDNPIIGQEERNAWPLPDRDYTIYDVETGELGGTFQVVPGADDGYHFAMLLDETGKPMPDLEEPIPFVLTEFTGTLPADTGVERAWLIEWGPGPDRTYCQVQLDWPPLCVQALIVVVDGETGFTMPALPIEQVLAVEGAEAIAGARGGGAGFMPFDRHLVVQDGTDAQLLTALVVEALYLAWRSDEGITAVRFVPAGAR